MDSPYTYVSTAVNNQITNIGGIMNSPIKSRLEYLKNKEVLDLTEAAYLTSQSVQTLRRRITEGQLPATQYKKRGKWYLKVDDLNQFMGWEERYDA